MPRLPFLLWGQERTGFPLHWAFIVSGKEVWHPHKSDWGSGGLRQTKHPGNTCISGSSGWAYSKWTRLNTWHVCRLRKACERNWRAFGVMKDQRLWKTLAVMKDEPRVWSSKGESCLNQLGGEWIFKISQLLTQGSSHCLGRSKLRKVWKKLHTINKQLS